MDGRTNTNERELTPSEALLLEVLLLPELIPALQSLHSLHRAAPAGLAELPARLDEVTTVELGIPFYRAVNDALVQLESAPDDPAINDFLHRAALVLETWLLFGNQRVQDVAYTTGVNDLSDTARPNDARLFGGWLRETVRLMDAQ